MSTMDPQSYPMEGQVSSPPVKRRTNGFAVASLVIGILWVGGLGSILALVLGIMGLKQVNRSGQSGKGLAIAGIVLGSLGILTAIVVTLTYTV